PEVSPQLGVELLRGHAERLLEGLRKRYMLPLGKVDVGINLRRFAFQQEIMDGQPGLRVEDVATATLVVIARLVIHVEEFSRLQPIGIHKQFGVTLREGAERHVLPGDFKGGEEIGVAFIEPERQGFHVSVKQKVSVLVKYSGPAIGSGEVERDEVAIFSHLEESSQFNRFAVVDGTVLPKLFVTTEGDDLERHGEVDCRLLEDAREADPHLFEPQSYSPTTPLAIICDHGKVFGTDLDPFRLSGVAKGWNSKCDKES